MKTKKTAFAVMFGNRGFFPSSFQASARQQFSKRLEQLGYEVLMMELDATNHGAIESVDEGRLFAKFLHENKGKYQGVILSLPNFGDELGAVEALKDINVPVFVQAYPDDLAKLSPANRRDSFCGKFALCDVLYQYGVKYTALAPHVVDPDSKEFQENMEYFDRVCRVFNGLRDMRILSAGARTTPFKSVRTDERVLQKHRISVESCDMAYIIDRVANCSRDAADAKNRQLAANMDMSSMPKENMENLSRLGVVLDQLVDEFDVDAIAIRCWLELQKQLGVSPCLLNGLLCESGVPVACEVDIANAVMMYALQCATTGPATILDWNNNYGDNLDKCIVFHCGNVPSSMLASKAPVTEHAILAKTAGLGCSWGCSSSRIRPMEVTFGSLVTREGKMVAYGGFGRITEDAIPDEFFGMAGVLETQNLQNTLWHVCNNGYSHHVSLSEGDVIAPLSEAFEKYLGIELVKV